VRTQGCRAIEDDGDYGDDGDGDGDDIRQMLSFRGPCTST
jgi:hypothetical protein